MRRITMLLLAAALLCAAQRRANAQRYLSEIVASGDSLSQVKVFSSVGPINPLSAGSEKGIAENTITETADFLAFHHRVRGARVAIGDVNGDDVLDVIVGSGPGGLSELKVVDGNRVNDVDEHGVILRSALLADFRSIDRKYRGGILVAAGDVNADGKDDVIVGADAGYRPVVRVFDGARLTPGLHSAREALIGEFLAFDHRFRGGVSVAAGDITGDGYADVVAGARSHSEAFVIGVDGTSIGLPHAGHPLAARKVIAVSHEFTAYDPAFRGGVLVAVGNISGGISGISPSGAVSTPAGAQIVTGPANPGDGEVRAFDADDVKAAGDYLSLRVFGDNFVGGVRVAAADLDGDGNMEVFGGSSPNTGIDTINIAEYDGSGNLLPAVQFAPFGAGYSEGIYVAAKRIELPDVE